MRRRQPEPRLQENGNCNNPLPPEVFIELQDHNKPMRFRNVWLRKLGEYGRGGLGDHFTSMNNA